MYYENNYYNNLTEIFGQVTTIMNLIIVVQFFKTICTAIFQHLLNVGSWEKIFSRPVSIYFQMVKTNGQEILHLHYLI